MTEISGTILDWHWLVLGLILIGIEALGAGGFLVGAATAAFCMAVISHFVDIVWEWQVISYALLTLVFTVIYYRYFKAAELAEDGPKINDRASQMIGRTVVLKEAINHGQGKIQIGDTFWKVTTQSNISEGTTVKVVSASGMILEIEPVQ